MNARNLFSEQEAESSLWTQLYLVILQRETPYHKLKTARNTGAFADYANAVCYAVSGLFRVLDIMGFLPQHFSNALTRYGKFKDADEEPKIAWRKDDEGKMHFLFADSFNEMIEEFRLVQPNF